MVVPAAVNSAAGGDQPPLALQRALAKEYLPMTEQLADRFGGIPREWATKYRKLLGCFSLVLADSPLPLLVFLWALMLLSDLSLGAV